MEAFVPKDRPNPKRVLGDPPPQTHERAAGNGDRKAHELGDLYFAADNFAVALEYYRRALEIEGRRGDAASQETLLKTGTQIEHRFRSADAIEKVTVDEVEMQYLYNDGDDYYFMNTENYEQTHLRRDVLGDAVDYLIPNLQIEVEFFDGKPVGVELPQTIEMTVVETEPGLKSATASSVTKPAKLETGLVVQVPPFINEGEKIRVDTSQGAYLSRA